MNKYLDKSTGVIIWLATGIFLASFNSGVLALQTSKVEIGIEEKLGNQVPMDLTFIDESGKKVQLRDIVKKPTILSLVYYECPAICSPLLTGLADVLSKTQMAPGKDYLSLTISIDPTETPELARGKKKNYLKSIGKPFPEDGWRFFTGSQDNITQIADAVGWRYKKQGKDFAHAAALVILSPNGKVIRYFYGIQYLPFDLKMALVEAGEGKVGPTINRVLLYCFSYDPEGRNYAFNLLKVTGTLTILFGLTFFAVLVFKGKSRKSE